MNIPPGVVPVPESAPHRYERCKATMLNIWQRHHRSLTGLFALLSIIWGIISGISLTRDYAQSTRLLAYLALFVAVSVLFRIWLEYARRRQASQARRAIVGFMLARPKLVEGVAFFATQAAISYISMFCLPLLFLAHAWVSLALALLLAVVSLVDPWWSWVSHRPWCMAVVRCFGAVLAVSFSFAVFYPKQLGYFYAALAVVAVLSTLPWDLLIDRHRPRLKDVAPCLVTMILIVAAALTQHDLRVPLLSVWLDHPALGLNVAEHRLLNTWRASESRSVIEAAQSQQEAVCCFTPVVSPSGVEAAITHEWLVDGEVVDRIDLAAIQGLGKVKGTAFHTHSCKEHLPAAAKIHTLGCRVYLDHDIYLGQVQVDFE